jgi:hypothetical protein
MMRSLAKAESKVTRLAAELKCVMKDKGLAKECHTVLLNTVYDLINRLIVAQVHNITISIDPQVVYNL